MDLAIHGERESRAGVHSMLRSDRWMQSMWNYPLLVPGDA